MGLNLFTILLFVHIMAAAVWIGGGLAALLVGGALRSSGDAGAFGAFCRALARLGGPMFGGSSGLVLATGIWMVAKESYLEFSAPWISIGFAGWLVSMLVGAIVVGPSWGKVGAALSAPGATIESASSAIDKAVRISWIDLLVRIAVVLVMVWRPS